MTIESKIAGFRAVRQFDNWAQVATNRLFFPSSGCVIYRLGDVEMVVDHRGGDANGVRACLTTTMYRNLVAAICDRGGRFQCVLDIGANGGGFTLLIHLMGIPIDHVACVEMNPRVFGRLAFNLYQNLYGSVITLIHGAIAATSGCMKVSLGRGSTGETLVGTPPAIGNGERIELLSLDDIVMRAFGAEGIIDLCKIDVEGAEYEVFFGAKCTLVSRIRYLIIEIHEIPGRSQRALVKCLNDLGFEDITPSARSEQNVLLLQNHQVRER